MTDLSSKELLKIWEKQYGKLDNNKKLIFLNDKRLKTILVHSKKDILLAVYTHQKLDKIITFLEHHRKSLGKNKVIEKPDKFDMAIKLKKNATKAELLILKKLNEVKSDFRFEFQYILLGYIVDFYFPESLMVVEIDGKIHENQVGDDAKRSQILGAKDIAVYRFTNEHVLKDSADVLRIILSLANKRMIHQHFTKSKNPQQELKEKTVIKTSKAKGEILYEIPKTIYLRCEECSTQMSTKKKIKMVCKICKSNKSVVRICFVCRRNPTPMKISMCNPCQTSRRIARIEVGASKEHWRSGTHKARKLM
jgi:very-short-patch-repair endonuclease